MSTRQKEAALRAAATPSELKLKDLLAADARLATRFKFQAAVPGCSGIFADFLSTQDKLIIELDGACHSKPAAKIADAKRTLRLKRKGWRVIRFWNGELRDPADVMRRIWQALLFEVAPPAAAAAAAASYPTIPVTAAAPSMSALIEYMESTVIQVTPRTRRNRLEYPAR